MLDRLAHFWSNRIERFKDITCEVRNLRHLASGAERLRDLVALQRLNPAGQAENEPVEKAQLCVRRGASYPASRLGQSPEHADEHNNCRIHCFR